MGVVGLVGLVWCWRMRVDESRLTATYLMASRKHGTLYVGSALDLIVRVSEHKEGIGSAFCAKVWRDALGLVSGFHACQRSARS
jgi:predicted GIY-YIG superfamily endonuclease